MLRKGADRSIAKVRVRAFIHQFYYHNVFLRDQVALGMNGTGLLIVLHPRLFPNQETPATGRNFFTFIPRSDENRHIWMALLKSLL
jgi:hypothetical protein